MANKKKDEDETPTSTALDICRFDEMLPADVDYAEMIDNLREMDEIDFPRVRVKRGKFFLTEDPEDKGVEEFTGVLLYHGKQNTYWEKGFDRNNITPPDCVSADGKQGSKPREGNKFGTCLDCYFNQFKSHPSGKGKACRNQAKLYILRQGTLVPSTLLIAPTSLSAFNRGFIVDQVTQKGLAYWKVITKFTAYQQDDETFVRVKFNVEGVFKGEEAAKIKELRDFWMTAISHDRNRVDTFVGGEEHAEEAPASRSTKSAPVQDEEAGGDEEESPKREVVVKPSKTATAKKPAPVIQDDDEDPPF